MTAAGSPDRIARKAELALTLATALAVIEILRHAPRWLLVAAGVLALTLILLALAHIAWIVAVLAVAAAGKLVRGAVRGWRAG